ncbi:ankyrin [Thozetella sp. PMI_491]|nr:ankyrin [Thozetella sp. PMI_491]
MATTRNSQPDPTDGSASETKEPLDVSHHAQRGTPAAALVNAIFSENVEGCRQLLGQSPGLANRPLRHSLEIAQEDSPWPSFSERGPAFNCMPPAVFACLIPRFKERCRERRAFSLANLAVLTILSEHGAKLEGPGVVDGWEWTTHILAEVCWDCDCPEALDLLISIGADVYTRETSLHYLTLLETAASRGCTGAVGLLLDRGVPMKYDWIAYGGQKVTDGNRSKVDETPLHVAALNARSEVVRLLLGRGAILHLEELACEGRTALMCAATGLHPSGHSERCQRKDQREETIRILVEAGADVQTKWTTDGCNHDSVLGHIVSWAGADVIRYLAEKGSDIQGKGGHNMCTPLHEAAYAWNAAGLQALLALGADPTVEDNRGRTSLHWATMGRYLLNDRPIFELLADGMVEILAEPEASKLAAMLAEQDATMRLLLQKVPVNHQDTAWGRTPLHYATSLKLIGAAKLLLAHGADPSLQDNEESTSLHGLAGHVLIPRAHVPLDRNLTDEDLYTLLSQALQPGSIDRRDDSGKTALHVAVQSNSDPAVALLLRLGADPNLPDGDGSTPLHIAVCCNPWIYPSQYELHGYNAWFERAGRVRDLLQAAGADAGLRDREGRTAAEVEEAELKRIQLLRQMYLDMKSVLGGGWRLASDGKAYSSGRGRGSARTWPFR